MGYVRNARSFSFMGFDSLRRTVDVVPVKEDHPVLIEPRRQNRSNPDGTVTMTSMQFVQSGQTNFTLG